MSVKFIEEKLELVVKKNTEENGLFSIYPLPPGMGYTLGNSLRRTIFSNEKGFRIRRVEFIQPTVAHPYAAIPGVSQDVQEIILRLKKIVFKPRNTKRKDVRVVITIKDKKTFRAGDIDTEGFPFQIINPEYVICDLDESVQLTIGFTITEGAGYVSAEEHEARSAENKAAEQEPGFAIDTIYTPVTNVKMKVENILDDKRVDFEKLNLEISTNKSIDPHDVLKNACRFLSEVFSTLANKQPVDLLKRSQDKKLVEEKRKRLNRFLSTPMVDLEGAPTRAVNCLRKAGYKYVKEITPLTPKDLLAIPNLGLKCLDELVAFLADNGLTLGEGVKNGETPS
ncbi:MAG: DNA-directed RNA polymerase subunit alpha [Cytophagales bacterium]